MKTKIIYKIENKNNKLNKFLILKNGCIKKWINDHYYNKSVFYSSLTLFEIINTIFIIYFIIRTIIVIKISDNSSRLLVYLGSNWHNLGVNRIAFEKFLLFWSISVLIFRLFLLNLNSDQYVWIKIFTSLANINSVEELGNFDFLYLSLTFSSISS